MKRLQYNLLDKVKRQVDDILSNELRECRYTIYAHYQSNHRNFLFSYKIKGNCIHLFVNIQTILLFMEKNDWSERVSLYFCAWYVSNYIKTLLGCEQKRNINTYCNGIVVCEALYSLCSKKNIVVYVSYICEVLCRNIKRMGVINILCETNTLLRIKAMFVGELSQSDKACIDDISYERQIYLKNPEVVYIGIKTPSMSVKEYITKIRVINKKKIENDLPKLPKKKDEIIIQNIMKCYKANEDVFWVELLAHIIVYSPNNAKYINDYEVLNQIYGYIERYEECLIDDIKIYEQSKNKLMMDNLNIMFKYIERGRWLLSKAGFVREDRRKIHINY